MHKRLALTFIPLAFASSLTMAQELEANQREARLISIEEILVTAQKRESSLQDTPISIAAFSGEQLERFGIDDFGDLAGLAPNVDITPFPNSRSSLVVFMRGVGNNDSQTTQDPAVGVYIDGVYVGRSVGLTGDIANIARVEVLRGPQGTLYGRNTTGGAVNIITDQPSGDFGLKLSQSIGNRGYLKSLVDVESPEFGGFAINLTHMESEKDGWVKNEAVGEPDFAQEDKEASRLAMRWDIDEVVSLKYAYDRSEIVGPQNYYQVNFVNEEAISASASNDPAGFAVLQSAGFYDHIRNVQSDKRRSSGAFTNPVRNSVTEIDGHTFTLAWALNDAELKLIVGQRNLEESITQDYGAGFQANAPSNGGFFEIEVDVEHEQLSYELQLVGDIGDRIKYAAGLYYFEEDASEHEVDITFSAGGATDPILEDRSIFSHNEAAALYGQVSYVVPALQDRLELTLGGRYTQDDRQARKRSKLFTNSPNNTQEDSESYSNFNPSFTADFSWTDNINTYAKVVTGYKSGGFNVRSTEAGFSPAFDEEKMISYEVGSKLSLFSNRLRINAAGFISEYTDLQIQQITDNSAIFLTDVFNAGEVEINGFELDILAVPLPGLTFSASYGYTDADFVKFIDNSPDSATFGQNVASDATAPYAPEETYTVGIDYLFPEMAVGDLRFNVDYAWRDERFGTARNDDMEGFKLDDYGLLNARLSLSKIPLGFAEASIALWGKNLDNEDYLVHSISLGVVRSGYWNEPQTYGMDISIDF